MARKRQIDPDIWTSEQVIALSIAARLMFIGMISHADDEGRLKGSILSLKVSIFPADTYSLDEIKQWREEIVSNNLAIYYEVGRAEYLWLPTFRKYQYMTKTFPSKLPCPPDKKVNNKLITKEQQLYGIGIGNGIGIGIGSKKTLIELFNKFWEVFPVKKGKEEARAAFRNLNPSEEFLDNTIIPSIQRQVKERENYASATSREAPAWKYGQGWLNKKRWEDEPIEIPKGGKNDQSVQRNTAENRAMSSRDYHE